MTKEECNEYKRRWAAQDRKEHPEKYRAYQKNYRRTAKGKAAHAAEARKYRSEHKTELRAYHKRYARSVVGRKKIKARNKAYYKNPARRARDKRRQQTAEYKAWSHSYERSPKRKAKKRAFARSITRLAYLKARCARITAKQHGAPGSWTGAQFLTLCKRHGNRCLCCHKKRPLTPDHVIPFCQGGSNHMSNIQPLCLPCNVKKGRKSTDYRPRSRRLRNGNR